MAHANLCVGIAGPDELVENLRIDRSSASLKFIFTEKAGRIEFEGTIHVAHMDAEDHAHQYFPTHSTLFLPHKKAGLLSSFSLSPLLNTGGGMGSCCSSLPSRAARTSAQTFSDLSGISMVLMPRALFIRIGPFLAYQERGSHNE